MKYQRAFTQGLNAGCSQPGMLTAQRVAVDLEVPVILVYLSLVMPPEKPPPERTGPASSKRSNRLPWRGLIWHCAAGTNHCTHGVVSIGVDLGAMPRRCCA
jgi:hypothetical protein